MDGAILKETHTPWAAFDTRNDQPPPNLRIALYSHDTMGLGHVRRNLLIAQSLAKSPLRPLVLLVTGAPKACAFSLPSAVNRLIVPAMVKSRNGEYSSQSRDLSLKDLIRQRAEIILKALTEFQPDILIVDKVPLGALGELEASLEYLKREGSTRCVLGLRDILDSPEAIGKEWKQTRNEEAIDSYYDAVWIYGDPAVYDPLAEYQFSDRVRRKASYTGYLDQSKRLRFRQQSDRHIHEIISGGPYVLCLVGGGQDGGQLAEIFADARLPHGLNGVVLTGPFMSQAVLQRLQDRAQTNPRLRILQFLVEPIPLLKHAERLVAMGGYNTMCEIFSFQKRALIAPRAVPRREQLIRAQRLQQMGIVDLLSWGNVTPDAISNWLAKDLPPFRLNGRIDLNGLKRIPRLLAQILRNEEALNPV